MSLDGPEQIEGELFVAQQQPGGWRFRRWFGIILAVFTIQIGLIFGLSDHSPLAARAPSAGLILRVAGSGSAEVLALSDPTLFALPHQQGFSGLAWMTPPRLPARSFSWSEEPSWLTVGMPDLGNIFKLFLATNNFGLGQRLTPPEPITSRSAPQSPATAGSSSALRIEGALAQRRLLTALALPSRPHTDLLTNTVLQLIVDGEGKPFSVTPLTSSGQAAADTDALNLAWTLRFNSTEQDSKIAGPLQGLTRGHLIFEWSTVGTNTAAANLKP